MQIKNISFEKQTHTHTWDREKGSNTKAHYKLRKYFVANEQDTEELSIL